MEQMDARIRLLRNPQNMGVAETRNCGLELAHGEWIALLDSDDIWRRDKLEKQLRLAEQSGAEVIYCSYALVGEGGEPLSDFIVPETTTYDKMLRQRVLSCSTVLLHRASLGQHRFCRTAIMRITPFGLSFCAPATGQRAARRSLQTIAL